LKEKTVKMLWISATAIIILAIMIGLSERIVGWNFLGLTVPVILGIVLINLSLFLWIFRKKRLEKKSGFAVVDERTKYIEGRAAHYTLMIGMWFMLGLLWYIWLGVEILGLPKLETAPAMIVSLLVMIGLYAVLRWYLNKEGDGE